MKTVVSRLSYIEIPQQLMSPDGAFCQYVIIHMSSASFSSYFHQKLVFERQQLS